MMEEDKDPTTPTPDEADMEGVKDPTTPTGDMEGNTEPPPPDADDTTIPVELLAFNEPLGNLGMTLEQMRRKERNHQFYLQNPHGLIGIRKRHQRLKNGRTKNVNKAIEQLYRERKRYHDLPETVKDKIANMTKKQRENLDKKLQAKHNKAFHNLPPTTTSLNTNDDINSSFAAGDINAEASPNKMFPSPDPHHDHPAYNYETPKRKRTSSSSSSEKSPETNLFQPTQLQDTKKKKKVVRLVDKGECLVKHFQFQIQKDNPILSQPQRAWQSAKLELLDLQLKIQEKFIEFQSSCFNPLEDNHDGQCPIPLSFEMDEKKNKMVYKSTAPELFSAFSNLYKETDQSDYVKGQILALNRQNLNLAIMIAAGQVTDLCDKLKISTTSNLEHDKKTSVVAINPSTLMNKVVDPFDKDKKPTQFLCPFKLFDGPPSSSSSTSTKEKETVKKNLQNIDYPTLNFQFSDELGPSYLYSDDICSLLGSEQINLTVIDTIVRMLYKIRGEDASWAGLTCSECVETFSGVSPDVTLNPMDLVKKYKNNGVLGDKEFIFFPTLINSHYVLSWFTFYDNKLHIYNPLKEDGTPLLEDYNTGFGTRMAETLKNIQDFLTLLFPNNRQIATATVIKEMRYERPPLLPVQRDAVNCGIYCILAMEYLMQTREWTQLTMAQDLNERILNFPYFRQIYFKRLESYADLLSNTF